MTFFRFSTILIFALLIGCNNQDSNTVETAVKETATPAQSTDKEPISIMEPAQAAKELEAIVERERDEFILLYHDKNEKMYIEKNRLIRSIYSSDQNIISFLTLEALTSLRSFIFSEGFYQLPRAAKDDNSRSYIKVQSNKRYNHVVFQGIPSKNNNPTIAKIVKELHRISDTFRAKEGK